ncbi:MAG: type IV secretion system protein [Alphaproteobacteria bacterium]
MKKDYVQKDQRTLFYKVVVLCLFSVLFSLSISSAYAQPLPSAPSGTCTTDPPFNPTPPGPGEGIISRIVDNIQNVLDSLSQTIYTYVASDSGFQEMAGATVTLYVAVYGVLFMFAMVQITLFDFAVRMIKVGIIAALISPGSWGFFNDTVVTFFNDGTDSLISELSQIAIAGISQPVTPGSPPFAVLDDAIAKALSAKMAVTLLATFFTGPYGLLFGLLLLMSIGSFVRALLTAAWVYLMSLVVKTLLFGIAPLFILCLLFNRTRHLFQGWLNQVINASLQPIMLFAFFAFFSRLVEASIDKILQVPVCWTESMEAVRGTPFYTHYWRFTYNNEPYGGGWSWGGPDAGGSKIFPLEILDVLIFLILAELASRFNSVVLMIARDLANATTSLADMKGGLSDWMSPVKGRKGGTPGDLGRTEQVRDVMRRETAGGAAGGGDGSIASADASAGSAGNLSQARDGASAMASTRPPAT